MENHENPVMDERVIYLRDIIKMTVKGFNRAEKETYKAYKTAARYILKYWDSIAHLRKFLEDKEMKMMMYRIWCIAQSRCDQLMIIEKDKVKEFVESQNKTATKDTISLLNDNRIEFLSTLTYPTLPHGSESFKNQAKAINEAIEYVIKNWDNAQIDGGLKAFLDDEEKKEKMSHIWKIVKDRYDELVHLANKEVTAMTETTPTSSSSPSVEDSTANGKKGRKSSHYVGEIHPNGKWVWTEWKPGHFDWKSLRGKHHKNKPSASPDNIQIPANVRTPEEIIEEMTDELKTKCDKNLAQLIRLGYRFINKRSNDLRDIYLAKSGIERRFDITDVALFFIRISPSNEEKKRFFID